MPYVSLAPRPSLLLRIGGWWSRRDFGKVLEPGLAYGHNTRVLSTYFAMERSVAKWDALDGELKQLAVLAAAVRLNCSWCVDFGYWESHERGLSKERIEAVPRWRETEGVYGERELLVMEYAEAMTATEPEVHEELAHRVIAELGEAAYVELTAIVGLENWRSRANRAFGLTSQGFSTACAVPSPR
ncbi:carboxymuconolactone decarboxylase family protein [Streptomyces sp. BI20]|uniref:carboxymuconolactone decarboxylase family protein n=1 Tax=Streptomyces sp. BI20 TaxID=3403460 RepID=UPI003C73E6A9